ESLGQFEELRSRAAAHFSDRVRLGISPHAPYSISPAVYHACAELGVPIATHISESESEVRYLRDGGGAWEAITWLVDPPLTTGRRLLARRGLLRPTALGAHWG